jgi:hypothetical protein
LELQAHHRSPIAARLRNKVRVFRTKGESTTLWASRTCPIYVEFSFFSIALARRDVHLGAILDFSFPNHPDCTTIVSFNCHVSTAQGAQPDRFERARLACVFQIGRRSAHRWRNRGRDHVELSFVEITKDSRTVWIRTLREHQASLLGSYCLRKQWRRIYLTVVSIDALERRGTGCTTRYRPLAHFISLSRTRLRL